MFLESILILLSSSIKDLVIFTLKSVVAAARRPLLLALVTFIFMMISTTSLTISAIVFTGWWQGFFLELGVGLLVAGLVDIAVLGALHGLIEGTEVARKNVELKNDSPLGISAVEMIKNLLDDQEGAVPNQSPVPNVRPSGVGWPS